MSIRAHIPLLYHPTNVVILDDDPSFINVVRQAIDHSTPYLSSSDPHRILNYLHTHTYQQDTLSSLLVHPSFESIEKAETVETFDVDFSKLRKHLNQPDHYKKVVVALVDQSMERLDGLEFCRTVREDGLLVKLILFTGKAGTAKAVKAFNEGIIDAYLSKQDAHWTEKINELIAHYSWQQFLDLAHSLGGFISHVMKPLYDEQFSEIFEHVRHREHVDEFYVLDSGCSFLLLRNSGAAKQLLVRNEADYEDVYEFAKNSKAPYDVLQALRNRQQFPYTPQPMGYTKLQEDAWDEVMIAVDKIPGRELYYTIIDRPDVTPFSFNKYFKEVWPKP
ncbi:MAG: hypothetical protein A3F41_01460 [Coxiella sp. RIFCSPHIGHO2_12_FULL_44_14]|nr:MAG: hypothetical protein A3F41_01460 [Coxiella sp. RIFCSPHIGHO2_12_FULL_44_14]